MNLPLGLLSHAKTEDLERLARFLDIDLSKTPKRPALRRQWLLRKIAAITDPPKSRLSYYWLG